MLSCYFTTTGFYFSSLISVIGIYVFLYGQLYLVLSGLEKTILLEAKIKNIQSLQTALEILCNLTIIGVILEVFRVEIILLKDGWIFNPQAISSPILSAVGERYYKVTAEALRGHGFDFKPYVHPIYNAIITRILYIQELTKKLRQEVIEEEAKPEGQRRSGCEGQSEGPGQLDIGP
ncbi:hypothetical protein POM88_053608 [Heracleum sosnowskyi]|uniref:Uncharacterized protein n=1 Tax=Heracleum sosnowskyi TaxID=360622 RepID=A0AAD8GPI2_9APIA|nr:hypothetical protein POM88_053608 [Heracleum sosnowskyi]